MLQTLKLNNKKRKKSSFYEEKSLVGLTPGLMFKSKKRACVVPLKENNTFVVSNYIVTVFVVVAKTN
jgi:hypothetical protein